MAARLNLKPSNDGWQQERRNALVLLETQRQKALRAHHWPHADALLFARLDVEHELRQRAAQTIDDGMTMLFWTRPHLHGSAA